MGIKVGNTELEDRGSHLVQVHAGVNTIIKHQT